MILYLKILYNWQVVHEIHWFCCPKKRFLLKTLISLHLHYSMLLGQRRRPESQHRSSGRGVWFIDLNLQQLTSQTSGWRELWCSNRTTNLGDYSRKCSNSSAYHCSIIFFIVGKHSFNVTRNLIGWQIWH